MRASPGTVPRIPRNALAPPHAAIHILGVSEAGQRSCPPFGRIEVDRHVQGGRVLVSADLELAPREMQIAAKVMDSARARLLASARVAGSASASAAYVRTRLTRLGEGPQEGTAHPFTIRGPSLIGDGLDAMTSAVQVR
jgi:hypothetical protein